MTYYNTTNEEGATLATSRYKAKTQQQRIYEIFRDADGGGYGASQIHDILTAEGRRMPLTSVRRAISDLYKSGELIKEGSMIEGVYGKVETVWMCPDGYNDDEFADGYSEYLDRVYEVEFDRRYL
jgi:hypothetical protein